jgi:hypothetical protein
MLFDEALNARDAFLDLLHRRRIRDPDEAFRTKARAISHNRVFFLEQTLSEVARGL